MPDALKQEVLALFQTHRVLDIDGLKLHLAHRSHRSICRDLKEVQAIASYSHTGRYYTLEELAQFDEKGLWHYKERIGFSVCGTLKATIEKWVLESESGYTYLELKSEFVVRIENVLLELVAAKRILREGIARGYIYLSVAQARAHAQREQRRKQNSIDTAPLPETQLIEILAETIRGEHICVDIRPLHERLQKRGVAVTMRQIALVLEMYGVKKG